MILGVALTQLGELDAALYQGGFLWVSLATAVLVAVAAHPSSLIGKGLGWAPLVWLGLRSYGIYLWHWPIIMLTRPEEDVPLDGVPLAALQIGLTILAAALSYTYVETPIRRGGLRALRDGLRRDTATFPRRARLAAASTCAIALVAVAIAVALLPRENPVIPGLPATASGSEQATALGPRRAAPPAAARKPVADYEPVLAVGDSVMLGASRALEPALGRGAVVDAAVSRQFAKGAEEVMAGLKSVKPKTVVIHLGNNGYVQFEDLSGLLDRLEAGAAGGAREHPRAAAVGDVGQRGARLRRPPLGQRRPGGLARDHGAPLGGPGGRRPHDAGGGAALRAGDRQGGEGAGRDDLRPPRPPGAARTRRSRRPGRWPSRRSGSP